MAYLYSFASPLVRHTILSALSSVRKKSLLKGLNFLARCDSYIFLALVWQKGSRMAPSVVVKKIMSGCSPLISLFNLRIAINIVYNLLISLNIELFVRFAKGTSRCIKLTPSFNLNCSLRLSRYTDIKVTL